MHDQRKQLSELLEKGAWTSGEAKWILAYLDSPDSIELQSLMEQEFTESNSQLLSDDLSHQTLSEIHERLRTGTRRNKASVIRIWAPRAAIAASLFLLIGFGWKYFGSKKDPAVAAVPTGKRQDSLHFVVRHEVNTTRIEKKIRLSDGSLIILAGESEITYQEPFVNDRNISLTGKAYFKVRHDETKPFIVTSGDLTTTDLGTEFTVTAFKKDHRIVVRLYEGRVVISAVDKMNKRIKRDIYLQPGQEFVYGGAMSMKVNRFKPSGAAPEKILKAEDASDSPLLPKKVDVPWFMFNNQSLENVLTDLSALYNVEIVYYKNDIRNIYFTGKYNKSESLETILKRIAILNNLTITKKDSAFVISK